MTSIEDFIDGIPKAELHLHIEGSLEPAMMLKMAARNKIKLRFSTEEELLKAYKFNNLQEFLDIYYEGAGVLIEEEDFYELTWAYLEKIYRQNVLHTEIFFDPQTHTDRGIAFDTVINGITRALEDGQAKLGISYRLIMCFLRHLQEDAAMHTFEEALLHRGLITGIGLDSSELGNPPSKFERVFKKARQEGFLTVAHAGEEGPAEYIWEALELLDVSRIDHGNRCLDDDKLVSSLVARRMPLTVCPLSNFYLRNVKKMEEHPLRKLMEKGLLVTVNSDDPAYFGGYINENFRSLTAIGITKEEVATLARNSFLASFIDEALRQKYLDRVEAYCSKYLA